MKIKRLVASVSAGFEEFVSKVENHEAVADCVIEDVRKGTARVRVQKGRVEAQLARYEQQSAQLHDAEKRWNERAVGLADSDGFKALECVRRARQAAERREVIDRQVLEHRRVAEDLAARLSDLEQRLEDLRLKRTSLSSRAARAHTLRKLDNTGACESIDTMFDRWEEAVLADEYCDGVASDSQDSLEREFRAEEDTFELQVRLDELRADAEDKS